ncbi:MAG: PaaI family thioesterase [Ktedonobacteraceae bacterium]|nr:PaaI family thioesterase [Ktedonobacteraceae bacterium]MBO0793396.1 PaaI family thioesterase [Ktedonobacteraceae bacterium]
MTEQKVHIPTLEEIRQRAEASGYFRLLDIQIEEAHAGKGAVGIQVDTRLYHPQQIVHGGVIFTLADTAMSMALMSVLPQDTLFSTIEAKINYLRPVRTGMLLAEATLVHEGRTVAVLESTVYNHDSEERTQIARVLGTFNIQRQQRA